MALKMDRKSEAHTESEKSDAFGNVYFTSANGTRFKLGFVALKKSRTIDRQIIEFLRKDPGNADKLKSRISVDWNLVRDEEVDLGLE